MNNPFEFFGLDANADRQTLDTRYNELKAEFKEKRFLEGEEGEQAARNLGYIEVYYEQACDYIAKRDMGDNESVYIKVENFIKSGDLAGAQRTLDEISARDGEWHYLQSIIYYKQNWFLECKKQLEFAMAMDSANPKYRNSYDKLTKIMASKTVKPEDLRSKEQSTQGQPVQTGIPTCTGNCCCDMCLANSMCNCMSSCMHC